MSLLATVLGSGALAVTLMACYGLPPCDPDDDRDNDGAYTSYCHGPQDCNDDDPAIHECATDAKGDGVDQNCDGVDGLDPARTSSTSTTGGFYDSYCEQ